MKNQIILSALFAFLTISAGLLTLPGIVNADRQQYRDEGSSRAEKKQPHTSQRQVDRNRQTRRDEQSSRTIAKQPRTSRQQIDRDRQTQRREYNQRYRRDTRARPDYKSRYQYNPYYQHRPRSADRSRVKKRPYKVIINPRRHSYRGIVILHPYQHSYSHRYRPLYLKKDKIWAWIAFTAITLKILDNLNDQQQREHERALYGAISVPIDETVIWSKGAASGAVTPIWEGRSNTGLYCREFRQEISIGERTEVAYGTACRRQDGSWEIID